MHITKLKLPWKIQTSDSLVTCWELGEPALNYKTVSDEAMTPNIFHNGPNSGWGSSPRHITLFVPSMCVKHPRVWASVSLQKQQIKPPFPSATLGVANTGRNSKCLWFYKALRQPQCEVVRRHRGGYTKNRGDEKHHCSTYSHRRDDITAAKAMCVPVVRRVRDKFP